MTHRYGATDPDMASVNEFLQGVVARSDEAWRGAAKIAAAGILTTVVLRTLRGGR